MVKLFILKTLCKIVGVPRPHSNEEKREPCKRALLISLGRDHAAFAACLAVKENECIRCLKTPDTYKIGY